MAIRAFGTQKCEEERFIYANKDLTKTNLSVNRIMTFMIPMMNIIMNSLILIIIWKGVQQIAEATMAVTRI